MDEKGITHGDQPAFTPALIKNDLREVILPPEYNCRFILPIGLCGMVKILHGRHPTLPRISKEINSYTGPRIWQPGFGLIPDSSLEIFKKAGIKLFLESIGVFRRKSVLKVKKAIYALNPIRSLG